MGCLLTRWHSTILFSQKMTPQEVEKLILLNSDKKVIWFKNQLAGVF
jgi:hypothetical protein